jgi:hypothetical protein
MNKVESGAAGGESGMGEGRSVGTDVGASVGNKKVGRATGVFVGIALCVSASPVPTVAMAVCMISASLSVGIDGELLQEASITAARNKGINNVLPMLFILPLPLIFYVELRLGSGRSGS